MTTEPHVPGEPPVAEPHPEEEADRETVLRLGAKYAAAHADLLRRLGE